MGLSIDGSQPIHNKAENIGNFASRMLAIYILGILFYGMGCSMLSMSRSLYIGHWGGLGTGERSIENGGRRNFMPE